MATHSSILAWRIPWREEPGGLQFMGSQRVRHNWDAAYVWGNHRSGAHIASSVVSPWHREDTCYYEDCYGGWIIERPNETRGTLPRRNHVKICSRKKYLLPVWITFNVLSLTYHPQPTQTSHSQWWLLVDQNQLERIHFHPKLLSIHTLHRCFY